MGRPNNNYFEVRGNVAIGHTNKNEPFLIDVDDLERVKKNAWTCNAQKKKYLVSNQKGKIVRLQRFILNVEDPRIFVDHINGDTFDNRKQNLRVSTPKQNSRNSKIAKNNSTGYTGVRRKILKSGEVNWVARIMVNRKEIFLGTFETKEEAIKKRKEAENKYFGRFAPSNGALKIYSLKPRTEIIITELNQ